VEQQPTAQTQTPGTREEDAQASQPDDGWYWDEATRTLNRLR
jgi:hypothetical protein